MDVELRNILAAEDDPRDAELTLQALREHHLANRVVVARDGVETLEYLHANAYVVKPVDFSEFVDAVKQIGGFWALLNEPAPMGLPS